jgi:Leucine-rich repeat (LRR) protein
MKITEKIISQLCKDKNIEEITTMYLNNMNIVTFSITDKTHFTKIEFLSLQNNHIKNINFLKYFPNIWYVDLRQNQVII